MIKKHAGIILLCLNIACLAHAQDIKTEVFRTNTTVSVPAGQKIECISAEGKYTYASTYGSGINIYKGPRVKITKENLDFIYAVAPINTEDVAVLFSGISYISYSSEASANSWVFSGDSASLTLDGPISISYSTGSSSNGEPFLFTYKIFSSASSNPISATSVVIPSSTSGDVDVKLEQSADNVTWTECLPGTYNSSTVKRFFRLRAVEK